MRTSIKSIFLATTALVVAPMLLLAQAAPAAQSAEAASELPNPVFLALVGLAVVLLFAIAALGGVLRNLSLAYRDKLRTTKQGPGV